MSNENNILLSFTGPAGRTYFDRDGVLQTADENEIREEYDPLTGAYLGMLIESQERTNYYSTSKTMSSEKNAGELTLTGTGGVAENHGFGTFSDKGDDFTGRYQLRGGNSKYRTASIYVRRSGAPNPAKCARITVNNTASWNTGRSQKIELTNKWQRISAALNANQIGNEINVYLGNALPDGSIDSECNGSLDVSSLQIEPELTSYIPTDGSPVTLAGEDARFTDPAVFNNFERGTFFVELQNGQKDEVQGLLSINSDSRSRVLGITNQNSYFSRPAANYYTFGKGEPKSKIAVIYDVASDTLTVSVNGNILLDREKFGGFRNIGELSLLSDRQFPSLGNHVKALDFNPTPYTDAEARQLTKRDAATVIGECPNGGYYDYSDLSTMLIESDESGILAEDRKIARVGDPVGAILDKSGHGNHLTASTDSRRGVLRFDGENYYIERGTNTVYGFDFSGDYSLTAMIALQNYSDRFIVLCDQDGGSGNYAMIYDASTAHAHLGWSDFGSPRYYMNGGFTPASNRGDTGATLQTNPTQLRTLHRVTDGYTARIFVGGYTSGGWSLTGAEYGFAWASRLSEDNALIVEAEMRRNMPPVT